MVGIYLKEFAEEKGFKISHGVVYGAAGGYMCTFSTDVSTKYLSVSCTVPDDLFPVLQAKFSSPEMKPQFGVTGVDIKRESITFAFFDWVTAATMKKYRAFFDVLPGLLAECGIAGDGFCTACGRPITPDEKSNIVLINGTAHRIHSECAAVLSQRGQAEKTEQKTADKHLGRGIIGALIGALVGALPAAVGGVFIGIFVSVLGLLTGFAARKGYELAGGRVCKEKAAVVAASSGVGMLFGAFLTYCGALLIEIIKESLIIPLQAIPGLIMHELIENPDFRTGFILDLVPVFYFTALGVLWALGKINKEIRNVTLNTAILE